MTPREILVAGGTGFIGGHLLRKLRDGGVKTWVWARDADRARRRLDPGVQVVGSLDELPPDAAIDCIVNLAGAPAIGPPWTRARRRVLIESRVAPTDALIAWCAARTQRPRVMVSASAIGFYGPSGDAWLEERSPPQTAFQSELCRLRELATRPAVDLGVRVVNARFGLVLGADGGILARLALAARLGMASIIGDGRQWMSWVHIDDAVRAIEFMLEVEGLHGPVNVVAPEPVRQRDFQRALTHVLRRPLLLRVPARLLTATLGEMAELLVKGQRVAPTRLQDAGFGFRHPALEETLTDLLAK